MQCEQGTGLLSPYLDAALPPAENVKVEAHLATCPACRAQLATLRALKHAISHLPSSEEPTGAVRARVDALRLGQRARRPWRAVGLSMAAAGVLVALSTLMLRRVGDPVARLADDLVADHLHSVPEVRPAEIASSDPAELTRFFSGHVPFSAVVPKLPGATLLGGRLCKIEERRVELLFYKREQRTLSLFISDRPGTSAGCRESRGHHVCSRSQGNLTMLLVGELPADELSRLLNESAL